MSVDEVSQEFVNKQPSQELKTQELSYKSAVKKLNDDTSSEESLSLSDKVIKTQQP